MSAEQDLEEETPFITRMSRVLGLVGLEAASAGLAGWAVCSKTVLPDYALRNELAPEARSWLLVDVFGAAGFMILAAGLWVMWAQARGLVQIERLARRSAPLSLSGLVPFLFDWRLWRSREVVFLTLASAFGFGMKAALATAWNNERQEASSVRFPDWLPVTTVLLGAMGYATYFSLITIANHRNLGTASFDLGLEDNLMWNLVYGGRFFWSTPFSGPVGTSHFGHHATFFAFVMAPLYRLVPRPETLLVIQALLMGGAVIPLYLYASRHILRWQASLVAFAYLLYPPLHGANLYDFHYLPLGVSFLWLALWAIDSNHRTLSAIATVLAISVREDVAACVAVLGAFFLLSGSRPRAGLWLMAVGGGYFFLMKMFIMPLFESGHQSFIDQYQGLLPPGQHDYRGVLETVIANPPFTASVVLQWDKLVYLLQILVPLLFLPLRRPIGLLLCLPGFFFTLLSTGYWPLYSTWFQYTSYWTAFLFIGLVVALEHVGAQSSDFKSHLRQSSWLGGLVAASLACTFLYGAVLQRNTFRSGFRIETTDADREQRENLRVLIAQIPPDAKVVASENLVPHISSRANAYTLRFAIYDADYLLFQLPPIALERDHLVEALATNTFGVVDDRGQIVLAKRGQPAGKNAAVLRRIDRLDSLHG